MSLGRNDPLAARPDAEIEICDMQTRRARRHAGGISTAHISDKIRLELLRARPVDELRAVQHLHDGASLFVADDRLAERDFTHGAAPAEAGRNTRPWPDRIRRANDRRHGTPPWPRRLRFRPRPAAPF